MVLLPASRRRFIVGSAASLGVAGLLTAPAKAAQFEFRCASNQAFEHPTSVRARQMWEAIDRESGGRLHTQFFPNGQLGGDAGLLTQVRVGALQFLLTNPGNLASIIPASDISYLGFAYKDAQEALRVTDGPLGEYIRKEAGTKGLYVFRKYWDGGMVEVSLNARPVRVPEDLRGLKIRVLASKIQIDMFKEFGASPTPLNINEVYTALQTNVIDGAASPLAAIQASRFFEVQKYVSMTNHAWSGNWLMANAEIWKSLPLDLQEIVERNNTKHSLLARRDLAVSNSSIFSKLERLGLHFNQVDPAPFQQRLRSYFESWASAFGATEWGLLQSSLGRRLT
jgi:TRAP-type transport system periplasmic protein